MIRVGQQGRAYARAAETLDEVVGGVGCYWVEVDGVRLTAAEHGVASLEFHAENGQITVPEVLLRLIGPIEVVYLDADGAELGAAPFPDFSGELGGGTGVERG